jgi:dolichol-phosphate mannosyltransferase
LGLVGGDRSRSRRDRWVKRHSSRIANAVRGRVLGDRTLDTGCGLKVMQRDAYLLLPYFDHQHRFLAALFLREGFAVRSVPVGHRPRTKGRSKYGTFDRLAVGVVDLLGVAWLRRRRRPVIAIEDG